MASQTIFSTNFNNGAPPSNTSSIFNLAGDQDFFGKKNPPYTTVSVDDINHESDDGDFDDFKRSLFQFRWSHNYEIPLGSQIIKATLKVITLDMEDNGAGDGLGGAPYNDKIFIDGTEIIGAFDDTFTPDGNGSTQFPINTTIFNLDPVFFPHLVDENINVNLNSYGGNLPDAIAVDYAELKLEIASSIQGDDNNNLLNGTSNDDNIFGLGGNDTLNGLAGNDSLDGGTGNDVLNGGIGNDTFNGGTGEDIYLINSIHDVVQETNTINSEIDKVESSISYTLGNNLENLTLTGTANLQGTGNSLNNRIIGNSSNNFLHGGNRNDILSDSWGNDLLDGGEGNDTLNGGNGNDIYVINNIADVIQETNTATNQIDTVESSISYDLGTNVENLILTDDEHIQGNGNSLNNAITGNDGDNILNGGIGYDTLTGGLGNDSFRFNSEVAFNSNLAVDRIIDFTSNSDKIVLSKSTFTAITSNAGTDFSNGSEFATVTNYAEAQSSAAVIVYNSTNNRLFYNQNGIVAGFGTGAAFAELSGNLNLKASDFTIIS